MHGVDTVKIIRGFIDVKNTTLRDAFATNDYRFILDIDSTITRGGAGTIHPSIPPILKKWKIEAYGFMLQLADRYMI